MFCRQYLLITSDRLGGNWWRKWEKDWRILWLLNCIQYLLTTYHGHRHYRVSLLMVRRVKTRFCRCHGNRPQRPWWQITIEEWHYLWQVLLRSKSQSPGAPSVSAAFKSVPSASPSCTACLAGFSCCSQTCYPRCRKTAAQPLTLFNLLHLLHLSRERKECESICMWRELMACLR